MFVSPAETIITWCLLDVLWDSSNPAALSRSWFSASLFMDYWFTRDAYSESKSCLFMIWVMTQINSTYLNIDSVEDETLHLLLTHLQPPLVFGISCFNEFFRRNHLVFILYVLSCLWLRWNLILLIAIWSLKFIDPVNATSPKYKHTLSLSHTHIYVRTFINIHSSYT